MNKDKKFLKMIHKNFSEHPPTLLEDLGSPSHDKKEIEKIDLCIFKHSQVYKLKQFKKLNVAFKKEVLQFLDRRDIFWKQMGC